MVGDDVPLAIPEQWPRERLTPLSKLHSVSSSPPRPINAPDARAARDASPPRRPPRLSRQSAKHGFQRTSQRRPSTPTSPHASLSKNAWQSDADLALQRESNLRHNQAQDTAGASINNLNHISDFWAPPDSAFWPVRQENENPPGRGCVE